MCAVSLAVSMGTLSRTQYLPAVALSWASSAILAAALTAFLALRHSRRAALASLPYCAWLGHATALFIESSSHSTIHGAFKGEGCFEAVVEEGAALAGHRLPDICLQ